MMAFKVWWLSYIAPLDKEFHVFPDPDLLQATAYLHPSLAVMQRMPLLAFAVEGLGGFKFRSSGWKRRKPEDHKNWLVVEPTHLKNMLVKMGSSSSPIFGVKIKPHSKPPPRKHTCNRKTPNKRCNWDWEEIHCGVWQDNKNFKSPDVFSLCRFWRKLDATGWRCLRSWYHRIPHSETSFVDACMQAVAGMIYTPFH